MPSLTYDDRNIGSFAGHSVRPPAASQGWNNPTVSQCSEVILRTVVMFSLRQILRRQLCLLTLVVPLGGSLGCSVLMHDVDSPLPQQKVVCDAPWYSENCSPEIIDRIKSDRQQHIQRTLDMRAKGDVGIPLNLTEPTESGYRSPETPHPSAGLDAFVEGHTVLR